MTKIGIIKEGKIPIDKRVALTPAQAAQCLEKYDSLEVVAQRSPIRCFEDSTYEQYGIQTSDQVDDCDILLGVKEVPIEELIPDKTYFFFSHTIKKQPYNRELLNAILDKKIRMIDYEALLDTNGKRIIAFGRWAGIVGAYNAIWAFGKRYNLYSIRRANECFDLEDLKSEYPKVKLPNIKIALSGGGRVSKGAMEVLLGMGISKVTPKAFIDEHFDTPVFTVLNSRDYHQRIKGGEFSRNEFYNTPSEYKGDFVKYTRHADILIAGAFWSPDQPVLFNRQDILHGDFKTNLIADITCDIEGSIPSTKMPTTIDDPLYDYNPSEDAVEPALSDEANITVMAIDNLPCELPRDASESFGTELLHNVLPHLLGNDEFKIIEKATITKDGQLTEHFKYLQDFVDGKE
ncbi:MAG: saccharopine dehydrogenase (NAD+, L-lysine-forming) [Cyclobacteriaceae bacterium]|jgi:saccharopine dehydrogenase (NAD+, L-lysine-forming)